MQSSTLAMNAIIFALGIYLTAAAEDGIEVLQTTKSPLPDVSNGTTTAPPVTTTQLPPTTVAPAPHKKDGLWILKDPITNKVCLVAQMKILLDIPYTNTSGKALMAHVSVPGNASGDGKCSSSNRTLPQSLVLTWGAPNYTNIVTLTFASNGTSKQFWLDSIAAVISVDNNTFPNINGKVKQVKMVNSTKNFITPLDNSFYCPAKLNIPASLVPPVVNNTAYFTFDHFQLQPFMNATNDNFSNAVYCEGDNTPDIVPILVGCTLILLVVIVLMVYLWGRRSHSRGYVSM